MLEVVYLSAILTSCLIRLESTNLLSEFHCKLYRCGGVFLLMIRRPPRSTLDRSAAASEVYKRQSGVRGRRRRRGRAPDLRARGDAPGAARQAALDRGGQPRPRARGAAPVSYTHIRAHETVLDIVCRLLLEKKTKKHAYPH